MLCKLEELKMDKTNANAETKKSRENYTNIALLMFYPYHKLDDLKMNGSYWKLFTVELKKHREMASDRTFWGPGFGILQSIEDRMTMDKNSRRATDRVTNNTECLAPEDSMNTSTCRSDKCSDIDDVLDL